MNDLAARWSEEGFAPYDAQNPRWVNVGHAERLASALLGGGLALYGLSRRGTTGYATALAGGALLYRGVSGHCDMYQALGIDRGVAAYDTKEALTGTRGVMVDHSITIDRPVEEVYRFWRQLDNLPRFMQHLEEVRTTGGTRSHWKAKAPAGLTVEWDAEIINEVPNEVIGWRSLPGAQVISAGSVNFDEAAGGGTVIRVKLQYSPPGGKMGAAVARLFGEEPSGQIADDLRRLKEILETGRAATDQPATFWDAHRN